MDLRNRSQVDVIMVWSFVGGNGNVHGNYCVCVSDKTHTHTIITIFLYGKIAKALRCVEKTRTRCTGPFARDPRKDHQEQTQQHQH